MRYLDGEAISPDELRTALRAATVSGALVPILCGIVAEEQGRATPARRGRRVPPLAARCAAGHGADPKTGEELTRAADPNGPFAALAFKIVSDPHVGRLAFIRVYSGRLTSRLLRATTAQGQRERVGRLLQMHAPPRGNQRSHAGDIAAIIGLEYTITGDTLCDRTSRSCWRPSSSRSR